MPPKPTLDVEALVTLACERHQLNPFKVDGKDVVIHLRNGDSFSIDDNRTADLGEIDKFVIRHCDLPLDEYILILVTDTGEAVIH